MKWKYKIIQVEREEPEEYLKMANQQLNDLGLEGWELVSTTLNETLGKDYIKYSSIFIFKHEL